MKRRDSIATLLALIAWPRLARTQAKVAALGFLSPQPMPTEQEFAKFRFVSKLRELGWIDGQSLRIERGFSGHEDRLPEVAAALVEKRVSVILAVGPEAALAAARLTKTIPIVFWGVGYPVEQGLVQSLGRPGGNVTGVTAFEGIGIYQKQLELLLQVIPEAKRVAWIRTPGAAITMAGHDSGMQMPVLSAAKTLGIEVREFPVYRDTDFETVFKGIAESGAQAMSVGGTMLTLRNRGRILEFAGRERVPGIYFDRSWVELGGLMSYGANGVAGFLRAVELVDRILRGGKPGEIPVELPSIYEIALNLKTAKALGLKIPQSILARADRVIE
jgi:putative ABC transport system substrate-binding protein